MLLVTSDCVPNRDIERCLGMVLATAVRARHIGSDIGAALKGIVGGKLGGYEKLMREVRQQVLDELQEEARKLGADAVVTLRFHSSSVADGAAEVIAYGTAVKLA